MATRTRGDRHSALGPLDIVEQRESVSMAFLLLLERLTPPERAVFVLRSAFGYRHREIAQILGLSEANCQQLYHRAKRRIGDERPRFSASRADGERITRRFLVEPETVTSPRYRNCSRTTSSHGPTAAATPQRRGVRCVVPNAWPGTWDG